MINTRVSELLGDDGRSSWIVKDKLFQEDHMFRRLKKTAEAEGLPLLKQALYYAREKHSRQYRKISMFSDERIPYISHPLLMTCHAHAMGITDDETLAAVMLHDICEDCGVLPEELPFPEKVQKTVDLLTRRDDFSLEQYYRRIRSCETACIIKLLDRCNNVSLMAAAFTDEKMTEYILETEKYVVPLADLTKRGEYSDAAFLLKYQICSTLENIKAMMRR
ncbi:MAG: hypothetical protein IJ930_09325 [Lachnospiraceae bacterium]|nr:hypothetical protein [Lachnospiraceae bacterium]